MSTDVVLLTAKVLYAAILVAGIVFLARRIYTDADDELCDDSQCNSCPFCCEKFDDPDSDINN